MPQIFIVVSMEQSQSLIKYAQKLKIEGSLRDNFLWPHIQNKLNCVFLWENHKNLFFNTQKLDHDGNKMWAPIVPWDNTFQLVTAKFQETEAHFC